jgi:predicted acyltransferase (DUF342 family)
MATQIQFRRGTTAENNAFTGALAEITVDTTLSVVRVHDGATAGGFQLVGANAAQTLNNKSFGSTTFNPNVTVFNSVFIGSTANSTTYSNPTLVIKAANTSSANYVQAAITNSTASGASRWTAFSDNGSDANGWIATGITGSTFANASYTITGKNDGFLLSNGVSGYGGNLIIATGPGGGANSDIIFAANGFTTTDEKFRYASSTNTLKPYGNTALNLGDTTHWYGNLYVSNASMSSLTVGSLNLNTFTTGAALTLNTTGNAYAIINGAFTGVGNIGSVLTTFNTIFCNTGQFANITSPAGNLSVTTNTTITGATTITGNLTINGNLNVANVTYLNTEIISSTEVVAANLTTNGLTVNTSTVIGTTLQAQGGMQNTPIGNVTPTTALFTTVGASSNVTVSALTVNNTATIGSTLGVSANITGTSLTLSGSATIPTLGVVGVITVNNNNNATAIANGGTNGVGNIGASGAGFNTVFAKATTAQYADLAEYYSSQDAYPPGTVLDFGGPAEVTLSTTDMSVRVAGVVSTNPAYLMNSVWDGGGKVVALALTGRVPCLVTGNVRAGDMMVSAGDGSARAERNPKMGSVIGKALTDFTGDTGVIEVVVGRL